MWLQPDCFLPTLLFKNNVCVVGCFSFPSPFSVAVMAKVLVKMTLLFPCLDLGRPTAMLIFIHNFSITSNPKPLQGITQAFIIYRRNFSLQRLARLPVVSLPVLLVINTVFTASCRGLGSISHSQNLISFSLISVKTELPWLSSLQPPGIASRCAFTSVRNLPSG